jgi:hypothetical protein
MRRTQGRSSRCGVFEMFNTRIWTGKEKAFVTAVPPTNQVRGRAFGPVNLQNLTVTVGLADVMPSDHNSVSGANFHWALPSSSVHTLEPLDGLGQGRKSPCGGDRGSRIGFRSEYGADLRCLGRCHAMSCLNRTFPAWNVFIRFWMRNDGLGRSQLGSSAGIRDSLSDHRLSARLNQSICADRPHTKCRCRRQSGLFLGHRMEILAAVV